MAARLLLFLDFRQVTSVQCVVEAGELKFASSKSCVRSSPPYTHSSSHPLTQNTHTHTHAVLMLYAPLVPPLCKLGDAGEIICE